MKEFLLISYFMTCPVYFQVGQPVTITSSYNSQESCEKTCQQIEQNSLKDRQCKKLYLEGKEFVTPFTCFCSEK